MDDLIDQVLDDLLNNEDELITIPILQEKTDEIQHIHR